MILVISENKSVVYGKQKLNIVNLKHAKLSIS